MLKLVATIGLLIKLRSMNWIQHPVILESDKVKLLPLDHAHFNDLLAIARQEKIWEFFSVKGYDEVVMLNHLRSSILRRQNGEVYPFTVTDKVTGKIIGSTLLYNFFPEFRKLEIGWTWYDPAYWRTGHNRQCKILLLTYCFEVLNTIRVQLITDENNKRSAAAILGIGATYEGTLRNERIRYNGAYRNSMMFSIIDSEWPEVKEKLINPKK